jgi:hypothetical protein
LNYLLDNTNSHNSRELSVLKEFAKKVKLSVGSYHKGEKAHEVISQLKDESRLRSLTALQQKLNRSIDTAYKFMNSGASGKVLDCSRL